MTDETQDPSAGTGRYRRRPTEVEAIQWRGNNIEAVRSFVDVPGERPAYSGAHERVNDRLQLWVAKSSAWADMLPVGTWIIKEPDGTGVYPCSAEDFRSSYDPA